MAHSSLPSQAGQLMIELADKKQVTAQVGIFFGISKWRQPLTRSASRASDARNPRFSRQNLPEFGEFSVFLPEPRERARG